MHISKHLFSTLLLLATFAAAGTISASANAQRAGAPEIDRFSVAADDE